MPSAEHSAKLMPLIAYKSFIIYISMQIIYTITNTILYPIHKCNLNVKHFHHPLLSPFHQVTEISSHILAFYHQNYINTHQTTFFYSTSSLAHIAKLKFIYTILGFMLTEPQCTYLRKSLLYNAWLRTTHFFAFLAIKMHLKL